MNPGLAALLGGMGAPAPSHDHFDINGRMGAIIKISTRFVEFVKSVFPVGYTVSFEVYGDDRFTIRVYRMGEVAIEVDYPLPVTEEDNDSVDNDANPKFAWVRRHQDFKSDAAFAISELVKMRDIVFGVEIGETEDPNIDDRANDPQLAAVGAANDDDPIVDRRPTADELPRRGPPPAA